MKWSKGRIITAIIYVLSAVVYLNCLLLELWPSLYPKWVRDVTGWLSLVILLLWFAWCIVTVIKKYKNRK